MSGCPAEGPAQPDQAVLAMAGLAVQASVSGEAALVDGMYPMAAAELAMRAACEGD
jgi:NaMN:DMB phosphoribosyltransferase